METDPNIQSLLDQHVADRNNPHNVTKEDVGLSHLRDYPVATETEAIKGAASNRYLTPRRLKDVFDGYLMRVGLMDSQRNVIYPE